VLDIIIDTCTLVSDDQALLPQLFSEIRRREDCHLVLDEPHAPCSMEIYKHSPTPEAKKYRESIGYCPSGIISRDVYLLLIGVLKSRKVKVVSKHKGELSATMAEQIRPIVEERGLAAWWDTDRKWVSLAERATPVDICSHDNGFCHVIRVLRKENIGLRRSKPCPEGILALPNNK
jgi:hypothetical protein